MSLEKNTPERNAAAQAVRRARAREFERGVDAYTLRRTASDYIRNLKGISHLFDYVRTLPSRTVLDVGAGATNGIHRISKLRSARNLSFEATTLTRSSTTTHRRRSGTIAGLVEKNLGWDKTHITSIEVLRGIPNSSKGAVTAVYSLPYSKAPEMAIKSIDRVLIPGGVFKGYSVVEDHGPEGTTGYAPFEQAFRGLGYDVHISNIGEEDSHAIILAIKPGNPSAPSATTLYELDQSEAEQQENEAGGVRKS